jgi:hypothetical protein
VRCRSGRSMQPTGWSVPLCLLSRKRRDNSAAASVCTMDCFSRRHGADTSVVKTGFCVCMSAKGVLCTRPFTESHLYVRAHKDTTYHSQLANEELQTPAPQCMKILALLDKLRCLQQARAGRPQRDLSFPGGSGFSPSFLLTDMCSRRPQALSSER